MKKLLSIFAVALIFASCGSAPAPATTAPIVASDSTKTAVVKIDSVKVTKTAVVVDSTKK